LTTLRKLTSWMGSMQPLTKVGIMILADFLLLSTLVLVAYAMRVSALQMPTLQKLPLYLLAPVLSIACALGFGIYQTAARTYSQNIEKKIALSQLAAVGLWSLSLIFAGTEGFARSVLLIYGLLAFVGLIVSRRMAAVLFTYYPSDVRRPDPTPILIYGAGQEGAALADSVARRKKFKPVAFIDTDYTLVGRKVHGLHVFTTENVQDAVDRYKPKEVVIAKPGLTRSHRRTLVDMFIEHGLPVKVAPGLDDIMDGQVTIDEFRPIRIEDLLGRDPVPPDTGLMKSAVKDLVVMITGAGGSIGAELVRQTAQFSPRKLVLVDNSEFALFEIHREIEAQFARRTEATSNPPVMVPVLADVQSKPDISHIMAEHRVDVVFHAAAYKHVRMVQENVVAGIRNNVLGTFVCAEAAIENGVKRFILISTDKAVRPTSVMGASKRVAEMAVQALADKAGHKTIFSLVRFGNVLGSTGSVVPLFREQILAGGPISVTHPDVTRYFMLIPEAAQLVIQSSAMATGGDVFVLDMGEPIRIQQLAETMIELAGLTRKTPENPEGDIEIVFSGLKDGEKLYEELEIGEDLTPTGNPRIMRAREFYLPLADLRKRADTVLSATPDLEPQRVQAQLFALALMGGKSEGDNVVQLGVGGQNAVRKA
jgi:FlaA1/EpsC-like NDP-sugar epimerase